MHRAINSLDYDSDSAGQLQHANSLLMFCKIVFTVGVSKKCSFDVRCPPKNLASYLIISQLIMQYIFCGF